MNIRAIAKATLDNTELNQAKLLFNRTKYSAGIQNPELSNVIGKNALHVLIYDNEGSSMIGYALIEVKKKILANISFGPLCADENLFTMLATCCIKALQDYGIKVIRYQPPFIHSSIWQAALEHLHKEFISFSLPSELNWSSLILDISIAKEELIKSFSENHRRSLKKAISEGLIIEEVKGIKEMNDFVKGLCRMYSARELPFNFAVENEKLNRLYKYTRNVENGFILKIKKEEKLLGGIVLIKHNKTISYLLGFSDPDFKKIPVNHLLFLKSFEIAKSSGCTVFDFGGYARPENADEQLLKINKFKDGFNGKRIDHADTVLIAKNPLYKFIYTIYIKIVKRKK
jgi:lipid II:glycine glycyltransferase (peptidoglycan interpeptide bridge formation enzyme)